VTAADKGLYDALDVAFSCLSEALLVATVDTALSYQFSLPHFRQISRNQNNQNPLRACSVVSQYYKDSNPSNQVHSH
jgi:hypothetical protein